MEISSLRIPDDATVIWGGRNRAGDIQRGTGTHPDGITGVSVESAKGVSVTEFAQTIPHSQISITTVAKVRKQVVMW